ncbi:hypothetical protein [Phaeobacter sp. SYSU ZJ3003]|uniref:hypothetical protein n=1 Tax=Phaeobacter sp. SYSU ZJ3003 TaxID=2109330 RepID=UPI00351BFE58
MRFVATEGNADENPHGASEHARPIPRARTGSGGHGRAPDLFFDAAHGYAASGDKHDHLKALSHAVPVFGLSKDWEKAAGVGMGAALAARTLEKQGFKPDIIPGYTGWGELLFLKDVWPDVPIIGFFEYYYLTSGGAGRL